MRNFNTRFPPLMDRAVTAGVPAVLKPHSSDVLKVRRGVFADRAALASSQQLTVGCHGSIVDG